MPRYGMPRLSKTVFEGRCCGFEFRVALIDTVELPPCSKDVLALFQLFLRVDVQPPLQACMSKGLGETPTLHCEDFKDLQNILQAKIFKARIFCKPTYRCSKSCPA